MYEAEEVIRELNQFRYDALQRLLKLEMRVDELHVEDTELNSRFGDVLNAVGSLGNANFRGLLCRECPFKKGRG